MIITVTPTWMTGKKIQARYYWNYVIQLEETETDLKKNIEKKILFGLTEKL